MLEIPFFLKILLLVADLLLGGLGLALALRAKERGKKGAYESWNAFASLLHLLTSRILLSDNFGIVLACSIASYFLSMLFFLLLLRHFKKKGKTYERQHIEDTIDFSVMFFGGELLSYFGCFLAGIL